MTARGVFGASLSDPGGSLLSWIDQVDVLGWILLGGALAIVYVTWRGVVGRARLGTIQVEPLKVDGLVLQPFAATAELQKELANTGLLPPGAVPAGSPTADLAAAVEAAPVAQAKWLAKLIELVPIPPSSTSFKVVGTLRADATGDAHCGVTYELVDLGAGTCVAMDTEWAADAMAAIRGAADSLYRQIVDYAEDAFPGWARWTSSEALVLYRKGLNEEAQHNPDVAAKYGAALAQYEAASELDPDNMLVRLRLGNCLERLAGAAKTGSAARVTRWIEALNAYVAVLRSEPEIVEARYRVSVLLGFLADRFDQDNAEHQAALRVVLARLGARAPDDDSPGALAARLRSQAGSESKTAWRRLTPLWTILSQRRLRHQFELRGKERRQLRKALTMSRMALRVRKRWPAETKPPEQAEGAAPFDPKPWGWGSELLRLCFRGWVHWRYMALRFRTAGWQAHYNAAAFYALLPEAKDAVGAQLRVPSRGRAFQHLAWAIKDRDNDLSCSYVRYEDPDFHALRTYDGPRWRREVVGRLCGDEAVLHYRRHSSSEYAGWGMHVWGAAVAKAHWTQWGAPLQPELLDGDGALFRIPLHDDTKPVELILHSGDDRDEGPRSFIPAQHPEREGWTRQGAADIDRFPPNDG